MNNNYDYSEMEIAALAELAANDYAAACTGPTIRGLNGEKNLRGSSLEEVAANNSISVEEAAKLTVDLSSTSFVDLSEHWQNANIESAKAMIELMENLGGPEVIASLDLDNPAVRTEWGTKLHAAWLELPANSWAKGGDLDVSFEELSVGEQDKDIQQLKSLQTWLDAM